MDNKKSEVPPQIIPDNLLALYTCNNKIPVDYCYRNDSYTSDKSITYSSEEIERLIKKANTRETWYYDQTDTYLYNALDKYPSTIFQREVAVLGSITPWYESILLAYQAKPTTIEYNKIHCEDPRLNILTVSEFNSNPQVFDAVLSISSFEHDGLGRYGDPLDPDGDFKAMNNVKKMLRPGGLLFLSIPIGPDYLVWNVHRIYGRIRFPALLKGWNLIDSFGFSPTNLTDPRLRKNQTHQPVFVLSPDIY
jgi:SAM-dependent methyltransferase